MIDRLTSDELEWIQKEVIVAYSRYYSGICREGLRKATRTSDTIGRLPAEIRTQHLPNTSLGGYRYSIPLSDAL
jgi:hypothetical protein